MPAQLVLTVGMNPLPVLAAAYRLCSHFRNQEGLPTITAVCSSGSEEEARKVRDRLESKLRAEGYLNEGQALQWKECGVPPGDPARILSEIRSHVGGCSEPLHLHYTGGTKAMVAHAIQVLVERANEQVSTSYLDINDHRLRCWNLPDFAGPADERRAWLELNATELAELHGMTVISPGSRPEHERIEAANSLYESLTQAPEHWRRFQEWKEKTWRPGFRHRGTGALWDWKRKDPLKDYWPPDSVLWPTIDVPGWNSLAETLNAAFSPDAGDPVFCGCPSGDWIIRVQHFGSREKLRPFVKFLEGGALEYYVFLKTKKLLPGKAVHSFVARSPGASNNCEIDVVATLGYQLVAVSCTEATERQIIKGKGFEAWHRARQIGGDGARAVVVCPAADSPCSTARAEELERDLGDDVGLRDSEGRGLLPIRVFGFETLRGGGLSKALAAYLKQDLNWSVNEGAEA